MVDIIVEQIYDLVRAIWPFYVRFQEFALSKFPYAAFIVLASTVINATLATHAAGKDKPKAYWLHSLVQTVCAGFGGGIITPVILGQKPSIIFANELVIPMTVLMWYLVNYWNFDTVLNWKPIKLLWNVVVSVFRTNGMVNMVTLGCEKFPASPYYPTPFMGPLIGGTLINSLGSFLPADRGLGAIQNGTAWALQSAFVTAALFFFIVKDREGIIGQVVRFFTGDLSVRATRALVCGLQVITLGSQVIFDDPNANFFTPIHKALYAITGVQAQRPPVVPAIPAAATATVKDVDAKPATPAKPEVPKKKGMTFARFARYVYMLFAGFMALYYLGFKVPAPSIPSVSISSQKMDKAGGMTITLDALPIDGISVLQPLGRCQWSPLMPDLPASQLQQCQPMTLKLFEHVECATSAESCAPSKTSTLLKDRKALKTTFRLSVTQTAVSQSTHDASATVYSSPSTSSTALAANSSDQLENRNSYNNQFLWLSELPVEFSSAEDLSIADPNYSIDSVQLFVTAEGELVLLSSVDITGTIFDPRKVSGRVLWRAQPERHCGNKPGSGLGSVTTTALRLSADSHVPQLQCSDGDNVDLDIGTLLVNKQAFQSVNRVQGAIPAILGRSAKSEL